MYNFFVLRKGCQMIEFECDCERGFHSAPVDEYIIEEGALGALPRFLEKYERVYVVSAATTEKVAGERVKNEVARLGKLFSHLVLPESPLPSYDTLGNVLVHMHNPSASSDIFGFSPKPDLFLAVGSGTINDSCRLVSYRMGIPYGVVATAPSMDGYLSAGSPILFDGGKNTIKCTTPRFLIADTSIIKDAPFDMLLAGIGDMFGKYVGILDWELARDYSGEYFCERIAGEVIKATDSCLKSGALLRSRDEGVIKSVMEGFVITGLGMAYTGNSRPASGSEHIVAHAFELEDVSDGRKPNLHGLEVCEGTRIIAEMYKLLYSETEDGHLRSLIEGYLPSFEAVERFARDMEMPVPVTDYDRIVGAIMKAVTMRDRYTVLFYLRDRGELERYARESARAFIERLK